MSIHRFTEPFVTFDDIARIFDDAVSRPSGQQSGHEHSRQLTSTSTRAFSPRYVSF